MRKQSKTLRQPQYVYSTRVDDTEPDRMIRYDVHHKGKNIAYLSIRPNSSEGDGPWVSGVYVKPKYRNQGLAKKLLEKMYQDYPNKNVRLLPRPYKDKKVDKDTLSSIYAKMGYKVYDEKGRMVRISRTGDN